MSAEVEDVPLWYHCLDLPNGKTTPGWFDLRPILDQIPWPDLVGKRCLDVGTYDGALAFEMERRGAAEVVATDIPDHKLWDWLPRHREHGPSELAGIAGAKGKGFEVAKALLNSNVQREWLNIYDLSAERIGTFDVVTCGALLLHLRDPFRAVEALASVARTTLVSIEQVDPVTSIMLPRRPVAWIEGLEGRWSIVNAAGHRRMLEVAGFTIEEARTFAEPLGPAHPQKEASPRRSVRSMLQRARFGTGVPKSAIRASVDVRFSPLAREITTSDHQP